MIVFVYQKGSPLLARYLELNRMKFVQVWREGRKQNRVALCSESGIGFPVSARGSTDYFRASIADCNELARQISAHTGLPILEAM